MIFNLFKSKPTLIGLIPKGFVDIHSHILPGIDDGANNINESIELISEMRNIGFNKIIATPHIYPGLYENNFTSINNSFNKLKKYLKDKIDINISFGAEYFCNQYLLEEIEKNNLICLKENNVLVETSYVATPLNFFEIIFKISINNYIPILAHPERYIKLYESFGLKGFFKLADSGCKFQVNLLSTTGYYGNEVLKLTNVLINNNLIEYVGSDIHNLNHLKFFDSKVRIKKIEKLEKAIENNTITFS